MPQVTVLGSLRTELRVGRHALFVSLTPEGGRAPALAGQGPFHRRTRFAAVDGQGRFRLRVAAGRYTASIGTRDELLDGKPRAQVKVQISQSGLQPATL